MNRSFLLGFVLVGSVFSLAACGSSNTVAASTSADTSGGRGSFSGGFRPRNAPYGGFGGGSCTATRVPVVFLHGTASDADVWLSPDSSGGPSTIEALHRAGYNDCELFGLTWISPEEQFTPNSTVHTRDKAQMVSDFVRDVLAYTRAPQVDVVGWSFGVTASIHGLDYGDHWAQVRRFVGIAGVLRGLHICLSPTIGPINPFWKSCYSQEVADPESFGVYPAGDPFAIAIAINPRMAAGGYRDAPADHDGTTFFTIGAGDSDEVLCSTGYGCDTYLFDSAPNVAAQLDVGQGHPLLGPHYDIGGVGHLRARSDTADLVVKMLTGGCAGAACCDGHDERCVDAEGERL